MGGYDTPLSTTILSLRLRYEKMCSRVSLLSTTLLQVGRGRVCGVIMRGWGVCKWSDNEGVGCVQVE